MAELLDIARVPGETVAGCSISGRTIAGLCVGAQSPTLESMPRIVDAQVRDVVLGGAVVQWVVFERCLFENLSGPTLIVSGLFRQTRLAGTFGRIMVRDTVLPEEGASLFRTLRRRFYAASDWSLDISAAEFVEFDCRNIPGDRIVRNETEQGLVVRSGAERALRTPALQANAWRGTLERRLEGDLESWVLVPPRGRPGKALRAALADLRNEGCAL